jgi:predicted PurR-regulated permease PerM
MLGIDARAARYTWTAAVVLLLLWLVFLMRSTLFLFAVALLLAYLLAPLVNLIDRFLPGSRTRTPALAIAYIVLLAVLFVTATQIGSRVVDQANSLAKSMPTLIARLQQTGAPGSLQEQIARKAQEQIAKSSGDIIAALPGAAAKLIALASDLLYVVIVPILSFFFLKDGRAMRDYCLEAIGARAWRGLAEDLMADINLLLAHYMRAILLLSLATFIAFTIFLTILGVQYSVLLAVLAGTLEYIPMLGPLGAGVVILVVTLATRGPFLATLAFLLVYRLFQDYVLSPYLMGSGVELHPLIVVFGVLAGVEIAGVPGVFLSVPVLALARVLYRRLYKFGRVAPRPLPVARTP